MFSCCLLLLLASLPAKNVLANLAGAILIFLDAPSTVSYMLSLFIRTKKVDILFQVKDEFRLGFITVYRYLPTQYQPLCL